jgi:HD-like signal output (HDOD) protein
LQAEIESKYPNTATMSSLISHNPELLADFLKIANRATQPKEPIKDARSAVALMGLEEIRDLFICVTLARNLAENYFEKQMLADAIKAGLAAAELSYWVYEVTRTEAYMAALLQNVGAVFHYRANKELYEEHFPQHVIQPYSAIGEEHRMFGTTHCHTGVILAKKWQVNGDVIKSLLLHHDKDFIAKTTNHPKVRQLTALIMLANFSVVHIEGDEYIHSEMKEYRDNALKAVDLPATALRAAESAVKKWSNSGLSFASH